MRQIEQADEPAWMAYTMTQLAMAQAYGIPFDCEEVINGASRIVERLDELEYDRPPEVRDEALLFLEQVHERIQDWFEKTKILRDRLTEFAVREFPDEFKSVKGMCESTKHHNGKHDGTDVGSLINYLEETVNPDTIEVRENYIQAEAVLDPIMRIRIYPTPEYGLFIASIMFMGGAVLSLGVDGTYGWSDAGGQ